MSLDSTALILPTLMARFSQHTHQSRSNTLRGITYVEKPLIHRLSHYPAHLRPGSPFSHARIIAIVSSCQFQLCVGEGFEWVGAICRKERVHSWWHFPR